jgi:hypothetical protein
MTKKKAAEGTIDCRGEAALSYPDWRYDEKDQVKGRFIGVLSWRPDAQAKALYVSKKQLPKDFFLDGDVLCAELQGKAVLPAQALDWLLAHQDQIPRAWRKLEICFWGTIYYSKSDGTRFIRYMEWADYHWIHDLKCVIQESFDKACAAALAA